MPTLKYMETKSNKNTNSFPTLHIYLGVPLNQHLLNYSPLISETVEKRSGFLAKYVTGLAERFRQVLLPIVTYIRREGSQFAHRENHLL